MQDSLTFLYVVYFFAIFFLAAAMFVTAGFVIPLQFKQAKVKNGLQMLRKQLLLKGVLSFLVCGIAIATLTSRYFIDGEAARYFTVGLVFLFSLALFAKAFIDSRIYHQQYSAEHIEKSSRIQAEMNREEVLKNKDLKSSKK